MATRAKEEVREIVRDAYADVARQGGRSDCCQPSSDGAAVADPEERSRRFGYSDQDLEAVPEGANMGLGCGNPAAIAALNPGETVLDLGSGAGFDCFLAARQVGETGRVIGVDMTPEMLAKARDNARKGGFTNVEFRMGEIERLPADDGTVDVIISNCVLNLSPDKPAVLREAYRVLAPGGRLAISDVVATAPMPESMRNDDELICGCIGGAAMVSDLERWLAEAGFVDIRLALNDESRDVIREWAPGSGVENYVVAATIEAVKGDRDDRPRGGGGTA